MYDSKYTTPTYKEEVFDVIKYSIAQRLPDELLIDNMSQEYMKDHLTQEVIYKLEMFLLSKTKTETAKDSTTTMQQFPATWWDHFKLRFFPSWKINFIKLPHITENITKIVTTNLCPHTLVDPKMKHMKFMTFEPTEFRRN